MPTIDRFTLAQDIAHKAGQFIVDFTNRVGVIKDEEARELVTRADRQAEQMIRMAVLEAFPEDGFLGEEYGHAPDASGYTWVVDPIDGTTNYTHHLPEFCVSIAIMHGGMPVSGVIYDPNRKICYKAGIGKGAYCNGIRIRTRPRVLSPQTLFGFSTRFVGDPPDHMMRILAYCDEYRNLGSAALHLCYVAHGRLDGTFSDSTKLWDIAAAGLIVTEAGGSVLNFDTTPLFPLIRNMQDCVGALLPVVATSGGLDHAMLQRFFNNGRSS